jgi:hypothetical protein
LQNRYAVIRLYRQTFASAVKTPDGAAPQPRCRHPRDWAKSSLASMVNRVLTSPYLWWFDPFYGRSRRAIGCSTVLAL